MRVNYQRLNTIFLGMIAISLFTYSSTSLLLPNGFGIDQASPVSKLDVNGNMTLGSTYSGLNAAPANGAIIEGDVGVGINAPHVKLDVEGDLGLREYSQDIGTNGGTNKFDDLNINSNYSFIRITGPDNNYEVTGITGGLEGRILLLFNDTAHDLKLKDEDILSTAANRFSCHDGSDQTIHDGGAVMLIYSAASSRWVQFGKF